MRILFICDQPQVPGGVQSVCRHTLPAVQKAGCTVGVLRPPASADSNGDYAGSAHRYDLFADSARSIAQSLQTAVDSFRPDLVHVISGRWPIAQQVNATITHAPWLLSVHNLPPHEVTLATCHRSDNLHYLLRNAKFGFNAALWAIGLRTWRYARLVCHSSEMLRRVVKYKGNGSRAVNIQLGYVSTETRASTYPTDYAPYRTHATPRLLTIAGIVHHKGIHDYLRAIAHLTNVYPDFHYVVIGGKRDASYAAYLEKLAVAFGLEAHVSFVYDASDLLKEKALRTADLYIQPSHEEGFCLAFLDAAVVVPRLLGTRVGAISCVAESDPLCEIVAPGDVSSLRQKTLTLLRQEAPEQLLLHRHGRLAKQYSWTDAAAKLIGIYDNLLSRSALSSSRG